MKNNKIIITGAGGFIGSHVVAKLVNDFEVVALDRPESDNQRLHELHDKIKIVNVDITNFNELEKVFQSEKPWAVLHLATHGVYNYQQKDEDKIVMGNYQMTYNLLKASLDYKVTKFVNTGSVFEYGSREGKVREENVSLSDILNKYSAVKMATTALTNSFADELSVITLRPFTTYGPGEDETRFMAATIKRAKSNEPIRIVKNVYRDFVYVEDVAMAYMKTLIVDYPSGEIISIGSGEKRSLEEVSDLIKKLTNSKSEIQFDESYVRRKESQCYADITLAGKVLNWLPEYPLSEGIKKMI